MTKINFHIYKSIDKRGSLTVEAAIFLPLFIIGIMTIGYLLKLSMIEENVFHSFTDESRKLAIESRIQPIPLTYKKDLLNRLDEENKGEISNVQLSPLLFKMPGVGMSGKLYTDLIGASITYEIPLKIKPIFKREIKGEETILFRAFVGKDNSGEIKSFDEMEEKDEGLVVWIFPRAGERYHGEHCSYIKNNPKEMLLNKKIRSKYNPCELCKPSGVSDGSLVYCFTTSGEVYHRGNCYIVERYVISIGKEDAIDQGYTECSKCGGE